MYFLLMHVKILICFFLLIHNPLDFYPNTFLLINEFPDNVMIQKIPVNQRYFSSWTYASEICIFSVSQLWKVSKGIFVALVPVLGRLARKGNLLQRLRGVSEVKAHLGGSEWAVIPIQLDG